MPPMKRTNASLKKPTTTVQEPPKSPEPVIVLSEEQQNNTTQLDDEMANALKNISDLFHKKQNVKLFVKEQELASLQKELNEIKEELHVKECLLREADKTKTEYFRLNKQLKDKIEILELRQIQGPTDISCAQAVSLEPLTVDPKLMDSRMDPEYAPPAKKRAASTTNEKKAPPKKKKKKNNVDDSFFGTTADDDLLFTDELVLIPDSQRN